MKKQMTTITECDVTDCAYNKHNSCHTLAITVGDPGEECPHCDTYVVHSLAGGIEDVKGGVGACKVVNCSYNEALECSASRIDVGWHTNHPDCKTYVPRRTTPA